MGGPKNWRVPEPVALAGEGDSQDVKAEDAVKVPEIGRPDTPSGSNGRRSHNPVVRPDVLPAGGKFSPDAGVRASGQELKSQRRKCSYDRLDKGLTPGTVLGTRAMHAVQQLRGRNCGDADLLVGAQLSRKPPAHLGHGASRRQAPDGALEVDEHGGV
jgi:hypothetical protein